MRGGGRSSSDTSASSSDLVRGLPATYRTGESVPEEDAEVDAVTVDEPVDEEVGSFSASASTTIDRGVGIGISDTTLAKRTFLR